MAKEMSIEDLRVSAKHCDLDLSDEELQRLLPGVNRAKSQAAELRQWIVPNDEPAEKFRVPARPGK